MDGYHNHEEEADMKIEAKRRFTAEQRARYWKRKYIERNKEYNALLAMVNYEDRKRRSR
jgi:hypothetical protein